MIAARYGHALAVKALLAGGADVGQVDTLVRMGDWAVRLVVSSCWLYCGGVGLPTARSTVPDTLQHRAEKVRAWVGWG
jgi:hypothetical protein